MTRRSLRRLAAIAIGLLLAALAIELGARALLWWAADEPTFLRYASFADLRARYGEHARVTPHRHLGYALTPNYSRGDNRHNALGFRGEEIAVAKPAGVTRVVLAGGSTTYCDGVQHDYRLSHAWMLQERWRQLGVAGEVINAGCPGWTSLETLINFATRGLDLQPDVLLVYDSFNDMLTRLVWPPSAYRSDLSGWFDRRTVHQAVPWYEHSAVVRSVLVARGAMLPHGDMRRILGDVAPTNHGFTFRDQWLAGTYPSGVFRDTPIEQMLAANPPVFFERNLRSLAALAAAHRVQLVLATFAVSAAFPQQPFVGHPAFRAVIDEQNEVIRKVGRDCGVRVFELAAAIVDEPANFTDGVHFTAAGNWRRAELIREYLREEFGIGR